MRPPTPCPRCGSPLSFTFCVTGKAVLFADCHRCGFERREREEVIAEHCGEFKLPIGKCRGMTVRRAEEHAGRSYLQWLLQQRFVRDPLRTILYCYLTHTKETTHAATE